MPWGPVIEAWSLTVSGLTPGQQIWCGVLHHGATSHSRGGLVYSISWWWLWYPDISSPPASVSLFIHLLIHSFQRDSLGVLSIPGRWRGYTFLSGRGLNWNMNVTWGSAHCFCVEHTFEGGRKCNWLVPPVPLPQAPGGVNGRF